MTQYVPLDGYTVTATTAPSRLNMPFTSDEVAELARVVGGENVVNAPVARLEELRLDEEAKVAELALSESDFYSFLATNILYGAPVVGAVAREARKSLGVDIDASDIVIQGIGFGKTRHQPAILCHVKLSHPLSVEDIEVSDKNKRALLVAKDDQEFFDSVQMSEIARLHLSKI